MALGRWGVGLFGGLAVWQFGSLAVWQFGSLAVWQFGSLAVWQFGSLAVWQFGSLASLAVCLQFGSCGNMADNTIGAVIIHDLVYLIR